MQLLRAKQLHPSYVSSSSRTPLPLLIAPDPLISSSVLVLLPPPPQRLHTCMLPHHLRSPLSRPSPASNDAKSRFRSATPATSCLCLGPTLARSLLPPSFRPPRPWQDVCIDDHALHPFESPHDGAHRRLIWCESPNPHAKLAPARLRPTSSPCPTIQTRSSPVPPRPPTTPPGNSTPAPTPTSTGTPIQSRRSAILTMPP